MIAIFGSARRALPIVLVASFSAGCGGGGGGGGGSFDVVSVNVAGAEGLPVNQPVRIRFTQPVDPTTVQEATVRVREGPTFTRQVPGDVVLHDYVLEFLPKLPSLPDASDGGFHPDGIYQLELPGFPLGLVLHGRSGSPLAATYSTTFHISPAPFFTDPSFGPPTVVGTEPPSSIPPPATTIPSGSFTIPTTLRILFSEPLRPDSVTRNAIALVERTPDGDRVLAVDVTLVQSNLRVAIEIRPRAPLPENALLEVRAFDDLEDLVGNPIRPFASQWRTGDQPEQSASIVESFDSPASRDPDLTNARWGDDASGLLESGYGPGGSGRDGSFQPASDVELDTDRPAGSAEFEFHDVWIPSGVTVRVVGSAPLVLRSATDLRIDGSLVIDGADGGTVTADSDEPGAAGGAGVAGGGAGGAGGCLASSIGASSGAPGEGPGGGLGGIDLGRTGGTPGGGGGGGYASVGASGGGGGAGLGGLSYGDATLDPNDHLLLAGSGGGGGACDDDFGTGPNDGGAGGGGGGGAALVVAAGDLVSSGAILARGGRGGDAGQGAAGGGGSGGALLVRARAIDLRRGRVDVTGGGGGRSRLGLSGNGGDGSAGRYRLEDGDAFVLLDADSTLAPGFDASSNVGRFESRGPFTPVAVSRFYDALVAAPRWEFDTTNPQTGDLTGAGTDLRLAGSLAPGVRIRITFEGADEDRSDPGHPDEFTRTGFRTDIRDLDGKRFVRFRVEFRLPDPPPSPSDLPAIDSLRIRYSFF
jgi:hypothetical protein